MPRIPSAILMALCVTIAFGPAVAQPLVHRPYDGLLEDARLTSLVDAQSERRTGPLLRGLEDEDPVVRARAALAAGSVQDPAFLRPLIALLDDRNAMVRADAAFALGQLRDSVAARPLFDALSRETEARATHAMYQALGEASGSITARSLLEHEPEREHSWSYTLALARVGMRGTRRTEVGERLAAFLGHPDLETRRHAAYYFWRVNDTESWSSVGPHVRSALERANPDDVHAGYLALAVAALTDGGDLPAIRRIAAESTDWRTRDRAVRALSRYEAMRVFDLLVDRLADPSHHVAETAARLIGDLTDLPTSARPTLEARYRDDAQSPIIRGHLARALARTGAPEAAYGLARNPSTAREAAAALAVIDDEAALESLLSMARSDDAGIASAALSALITRWPMDRPNRVLHRAYVDAFSDAVSTLDVARIYTAAPLLSDSAFVEHGSARLIRETFDAFEMPRDVEAAVALVQAARRIDHADTREVLQDARRHEHPAVRRAAGDEAVPALNPLRQADWDLLREVGPRPRLRFHTDRGAFVAELYADLAPVTVGTIIDLVNHGRYEGVPFHRVVADFVVQGGDFARADGFGGPGFELPSEFTPLRYGTGTVGMASAGKDTEGSQFFVTHSMQPHLDGRYTAFGVVLEGQEVVDAIRRDDRLLSVELLTD